MATERLSVADVRPEERGRIRRGMLARDLQQFFLDPSGQALRPEVSASIRCPCGSSAAPSAAFGLRGFTFMRCPACGFVFANPRPTLKAMGEFFASAEAMNYFQTQILEHTAVVRRERIFRPRYEWLARSIAPAGGRLLDVGCSTGLFLECVAEDPRFSVTGIEPNAAAVEVCRRKRLDVRQATIETLETNETFDVICGWELLRHVVEPAAVLSKFHRLLAPGGVAVLTTPNVTGFDFLLLSEEHEDWAPPMLLNGFTPRSLAQALTRAGFKQIEIATPGQLDVEVVRQYWLAGGDRGRNSFLEQVILEGSDGQRGGLQAYLSASGLSSHLRGVARA